MGKWAQQRKRGSAGRQAAPMLPPTPPTLGEETQRLIQRSTVVGNAGGEATLYLSTNGLPPYGPFGSRAWELFIDWGDVGDLAGYYYYATETGNGSAYAGESQPSNVVELN